MQQRQEEAHRIKPCCFFVVMHCAAERFCTGASLHGEESSHRTGRRFNRQGSNTSMASRASGASFASGLTGVSGASGFTAGASSAGSCYGGSRQLGQQSSYHSSAGSSGHTLRSGRAGSVAGSSYGGHYHHHHKKGAKKCDGVLDTQTHTLACTVALLC